MSEEYNSYLKQHCENVVKAYQWLATNCPDLIPDGSYDDFLRTFLRHDESKYTLVEYEPYDDYFYLKKNNRSYEVQNEFNKAFLHHLHVNPHHWQHWVLIQDYNEDHQQIIFDMPYRCVIEMICDWWSFSWASGDLTEIFSWYDKNKKGILLSVATRTKVENILDRIKKVLEKNK